MKNKNNAIPEKEFKPRNSVLTDMYEVNHFKSVRHLCLSSLIWWFLCNTLSDAFGRNSVLIAFEYFQIGFGQFHKAILIWLLLFFWTLSIYPAICIWAKIRNYLQPKRFQLKIWDYTCLAIFLIYYFCFVILVSCVKNYDLPIASSAAVLGEHVRMLMKVHAFVRSNAPKILSYKPHADLPNPVPPFSKYLYYLFVPTLVYRDSYPRTNRIRWSFVILNALEFCACLVYYCLVVAHYLVPEHRNYGLEYYTWRTILISMFNTILPGSLIMIIGFYLLLHAWSNVWAELLQFADRQFYQDWWNGSTYSTYYRKWNLVVHDYLHTYIYKDVYEILVPGNRIVAACTVFLVSAIAHEYIIGFMLGFCYPVLGTLFIVCGTTVHFVKTNSLDNFGNTFMWWSLTLGYGVQACLYTTEYYVRLNCPKEYTGISDYFIPRTWTCNKW